MELEQHAREIANIYRSHAKIMEYLLKDPNLMVTRIEGLQDTWLGVAEMIEREL